MRDIEPIPAGGQLKLRGLSFRPGQLAELVVVVVA